MNREPTITINGHTLTEAQAMTVRVALDSFAMDMLQPNALGEDQQGQATAAAYLIRAREVIRLIFAAPVGPAC